MKTPPRHPSRKRPRMALCLSSYKRPEDLQRQIYSMLHQTCPDFHLFVAVKGLSEFYVNAFILPQFLPYVNAGRLTLRLFPNSNQLTNLLDTVRGLDIRDFDFFLKIDDDDFYSPDYLRTIHEFCTQLPPHTSCCYSGWCWTLHKTDGIVAPRMEPFSVFGASMVMSREVMQRLFEAEEDPAIIRDTMRRFRGGEGHSCIGFSEDNFIIHVMEEYGLANIAPFVEKKGLTHFLMVQKSNPSVTRGGLVPGDAAGHADVAEKDAPKEEFVSVIHPEWTDTLRLYDGVAIRPDNGDRAHILDWTGQRLTLQWEKWGTETFRKDERGAFVLLNA